MSAIFADSISQSFLSPCMIQRESTQMYCNWSFRVIVTASLKFCGSWHHGMKFLYSSRFCETVCAVIGVLPQQWLRHRYVPVEPPVSTILTPGTPLDSIAVTSRRREGSRVS